MLMTNKNNYYLSVIKNFENISKIPRGSGNEKAVSDYIKQFAIELGLSVVQDDFYNLIIKKTAQNSSSTKTVMLQAHMDMVNEAADTSKHDFNSDPIELIYEGNILRANNTTLGADNGIGVAYMMSILESNDLSHPNLECVFTSSEEVGLLGVKNLDTSSLESTCIINLDSEEDDYILTGCAGAVNSTISIKKEYQPAIPTNIALEIVVHGLHGGHSGIDIDKQRGNAIEILGRVLNSITYDYDLFYIDGGSKRNVIPRYAEAVLSLSDNDLENIVRDIQKESRKIQKELYKVDPNLKVSLRKAAATDYKVYTDDCKNKIIFLMNMIPNGVISMSTSLKNLVETSSNFALLHETNNKVEFLSMTRSSSESKKEYFTKKLTLLANQVGGSIEFSADYPAWEYNSNSQLEEIAIDSYYEVFNKKPIVTVMHCGLESGILLNKIPHYAEAISIGPNIFEVHSPEEYVELDSVERVCRYLTKLLQNL